MTTAILNILNKQNSIHHKISEIRESYFLNFFFDCDLLKTVMLYRNHAL